MDTAQICCFLLVLLIKGLLGCAPDWHLHQGSCYLLVPEPLSWSSAEARCGALVAGGQLASVHDASTATALTRLLATSGLDAAWLGLTDTQGEAYNSRAGWRWSDGTRYNYRNWQPAQPNNFDPFSQPDEGVDGSGDEMGEAGSRFSGERFGFGAQDMSLMQRLGELQMDMNEDCVVMDSQGLWYDEFCDRHILDYSHHVKYPFICQVRE